MQSTTTQNGLRGPVYSRATTTGEHHQLQQLQQQHHRDLFTGTGTPTTTMTTGHLGIPDVTTHVGSVIQAFETMAINKTIENGEKPYELTGVGGVGGGGIIATSSGSTNRSLQQQQQSNQQQQSHVHFSLRQLPSINDMVSNTGINTAAASIFNETNEYLYSNSNNNNNNNNSGLGNGNDSIYSIEDDYRKNQFGTQPKNYKKQNRRNNYSQSHQNVDRIGNGRDGGRCYGHDDVVNDEDDDDSFNLIMTKKFISNRTHQNHHNHSHQLIETDDNFLRGTTVSQSFIKNIRGIKDSSRDNRDQRGGDHRGDKGTSSTGRLTSSSSNKKKGRKNTINDEQQLERRYQEYGQMDINRNSKRKSSSSSYKPRTIDRAII